MSIVRLLVKEILHRKASFLLSLGGVAVAAALFVALLSMGRASEDETRRLMRDLGFNLIVLPRQTDMTEFWATDIQGDMPEEYVVRLANAQNLEAEHYVATLQKKIQWRSRQVLLTGALPELGAVGKQKKLPMGRAIPLGECYVGFELARAFDLKPGDEIEVLGAKLRVARCLLEDGSKEDIRLYTDLHDAQQMLGMNGRINSILALSCQCYGKTVADLRAQLAEALPDSQVVEYRSIALARAEQREMAARYAAFIVAVALAGAAAWVGLLALLNVRERRAEIGLLRALGFGSGRIAALFLGRAALLGLIGAGLGFAVGTAAAMRWGPHIFRIASETITPLYSLLGWALLVAPLTAVIGSFIPAMMAVAEDPAVALTRE